MAVKRLNVELPVEQYEFLLEEARASGASVSGVIRNLIEQRRSALIKETAKNYQTDPVAAWQGSFDGPGDLAVNHDRYLYGDPPL